MAVCVIIINVFYTTYVLTFYFPEGVRFNVFAIIPLSYNNTL